MKRRKIRHAERRDIHACIERLRAVIEGLESGTLVFQQDAQEVSSSPSGTVEIELRVEQLERKETLRLDLSWRPAGEVALATAKPAARLRLSPGDTALPDSERPDGLAPALAGLSSASLASMADRIAADEFSRLYAAARTRSSDGRWHLDQDQLIQSLARAGVDPLTQQDLYSLALQVEADGRAVLFSERVIEALEQARQRGSGAVPQA